MSAIFQSIPGQATHGMRRTRIYETWLGIKKRCLNPNRGDYKYYGGRGILMHEPWQNDFLQFWEDVKEGYSDDLTIDRIDVNKNYEPGNVRWIPQSEQSINRSNGLWLTSNGVTLCARHWERKLGIKIGAIHQRIKRAKVSADEALQYFISKHGIPT